MLLKSTIKQVLEYQKERLSRSPAQETERTMLYQIKYDIPFVHIITGIRRCGKSTLLKQFIRHLEDEFFYLNFEDPNLSGFDLSDFNKLTELRTAAEELSPNWFFFDEIQNIQDWEKYIRFLHDEGVNIILTGSNASLLSRELGSRLTGRHLTYELYPFSFHEYLNHQNSSPDRDNFEEYMKNGGFPEFLKYQDEDLLIRLLDDVIYRDIAVRHNIRNDALLRELAIYLLSNTGRPFTFNSLKKIFSSGSVNTMIDYVSYLSDAYLIFTIPRFDYSLKKQMNNARKVYCIDTGLANAASIKFSGDYGRQLENIVFLHLRRQVGEIYYYQGEHECDFVVKRKNQIVSVIQVCFDLNSDNMEREMSGLEEAMSVFHLAEGYLVTLDEEDRIKKNGRTINIVPAYKWIQSPSM